LARFFFVSTFHCPGPQRGIVVIVAEVDRRPASACFFMPLETKNIQPDWDVRE